MERRKHQKPSSSTAPPAPRTLDVREFAESRAPELQSLHSAISTRLNSNFNSQQNKRRRTTGHDNSSTKKTRRRIRTTTTNKKDDNLPRRVRRRIQLRQIPQSGFSTSGDGTKRLLTHLWHAKRFTMAKKWGFFLPLAFPGRGRGSRALLRRFRNGALLHDATYNTAIQLEGPEDCLLSILTMVLVPTPQLLSGLTYATAMLHHVGAPFSQLIAPVTYMWRPFLRKSIDTDSFRQLWVWMHPGSLTQGLSALKLACQNKRDKSGISVNCFTRDSQLAKLEVMGTKSIQILQKILDPVSGISGSYLQLMSNAADEPRTGRQLPGSFILEHAGDLPDHAVVSLVVKDPRDLSQSVPKIVSEETSTILDANMINNVSSEHYCLPTSTDQTKKAISSLWLNSEAISVLYSDSRDLWENHIGVSPPVEENLLCMEKHQKRMEFFQLNENSGISTTEAKEHSCRSCPVLLLKKNSLRGTCARWDIILPLNWVKAFWIPLINHGAHAIGLRERRWIACDVGLPCFPMDFPDCETYSLFMDAEAVACDEKMELRPLAMRPLKVPIPPPWDSVRVSLGKDPSTTAGKSIIYVARTVDVLTSHLNEIHGGGDLLLFPKNKGNKNTVAGPAGASNLALDRRLCFVRVLLGAYKEGAFEEGADVCAPHLSDISHWTGGGLERDGMVQIPQSMIGSYYTQQASGKWELQKAEDPRTRESHRWPIGFVTTGFVRGSKKALAEGYCEATLLTELRRQQWEQGNKKQEIFVLVRNLRSASYRLALATIVLEQQVEDVDFL
ncbi:ribonuclease P [Ranunculus cassubicifolius]